MTHNKIISSSGEVVPRVFTYICHVFGCQSSVSSKRSSYY